MNGFHWLQTVLALWCFILALTEAHATDHDHPAIRIEDSTNRTTAQEYKKILERYKSDKDYYNKHATMLKDTDMLFYGHCRYMVNEKRPDLFIAHLRAVTRVSPPLWWENALMKLGDMDKQSHEGKYKKRNIYQDKVLTRRDGIVSMTTEGMLVVESGGELKKTMVDLKTAINSKTERTTIDALSHSDGVVVSLSNTDGARQLRFYSRDGSLRWKADLWGAGNIAWIGSIPDPYIEIICSSKSIHLFGYEPGGEYYYEVFDSNGKVQCRYSSSWWGSGESVFGGK